MSKAKQAGSNKFYKNTGAVARRVAKPAANGKSGLPSGATAKGKNVFKATKQEAAFTNPTGVMKGAGCTRFVN